MWDTYLDNTCLFSGKHAALTKGRNDLCFPSQAQITASAAAEITYLLQDSNYNSCICFCDRTGPKLRIIIPVLPYRLISNIRIIGNSLNCGPLVGMVMYSTYNCDNDSCANSVCITGDLVVSGTHTGCRYRCHCMKGCHAILIDIYKFPNITDQREICEIIIWIHVPYVYSIPMFGNNP